MSECLTNICDLCEANRQTRLAELYEEQGNYKIAAAWRRRALALKQLSKEIDPQELAADTYDLGMLYFALDDHPNAEKFLLRALTLQKQVLGEDHLDTCETLYMLNELIKAQDVYAFVQPAQTQDTGAFETKGLLVDRRKGKRAGPAKPA